jgi:Skp family chaperone for outer membrane proteins
LRLAEVLNTSKTYNAGTDKLKNDDAAVRAEMKKLEEALQKLDNQLQVLQPSNENFAKVQEELETTKLKRKIYGERMGSEMQRRHVALVKETYREVRTALTAFCKERGVMLVLLAPNPELSASSLQEIQLEMGLQSVLYFDPANDITEAFVPYFNDRAGTTAAPQAEGK